MFRGLVLVFSVLTGTLWASSVAFIGVNVVRMDENRVLKNKTVIVEDGVVARIEDASKIKIAAGTLQINARGLYLMPGLADMHVHLSTPTDLLLYLANGVTTIRNMRGSPASLALREQVQQGKISGPNIYNAGPILDGTPPSGEIVIIVESAAEAEAAVRAQKKAGYDFVKVYSRLSKDAYRSILRTAKELRMPVVGHVPAAVGIGGALDAQQTSIEHLTGYMRVLGRGTIDSEQHKQIDPDKIPVWAKATAKARVYNCATLVVQQNYAAALDYEAFLKRPEIRYVAPLRLALWNPSRNVLFRSMAEEDYEAAKRGIEVLMQLTKALQKAGAPLLLGTDSPSRFVVPGFSIHQELQNFVKAGLSPYEALRAGTVNAAEFFEGGRILDPPLQGKSADLLLVRGNPLIDVANAKNIEGVMVRGKWYAKDQLKNFLNQVVQTYRVPADHFKDFPELPDDPKRKFVGRYKILLSGTNAGEERVAMYQTAGGFEIRAQQSVDPPSKASGILQINMNQDRVATSMHAQIQRVEGKSDIKATIQDSELRIEGQLPYQDPVHLKQRWDSSHLFIASMVGSRFLFWNELKRLTVNERKRLQLRELDFSAIANKGFHIFECEFSVVRKQDKIQTLGNASIPVRVFEGSFRSKYGVTPIQIEFDEDGHLFAFFNENRELRRIE